MFVEEQMELIKSWPGHLPMRLLVQISEGDGICEQLVQLFAHLQSDNFLEFQRLQVRHGSVRLDFRRALMEPRLGVDLLGHRWLTLIPRHRFLLVLEKLGKQNTSDSENVPPFPALPFARTWRETFEHSGYAFVQVLFIFLGLVRERFFSATPPYELLCFRVVHIDYKSPFLVVLLRCRRFAETSHASPAPSAAHSVIERLECSFGLGGFDRHYSHIGAVVYLGPTLGCQLSVHSLLNSVVPQGVGSFDFLPRIGLVLREVGLMIKVGLDVLAKCRSQ